MRKVIKVYFKETGKEHLFGSYAAIFDRFSREEIGAVINSIWNITSKNNGRYENKKVVISKVFLQSSNKRIASVKNKKR